MSEHGTTMKRSHSILAAAALASCGALLAVVGLPRAEAAEDETPSSPIEVGLVAWGRDFDAALEESRRTGKPVFAFFQEVPGCEGVKEFGADVMSHQPIVEAIESEFVPLLIYNNRGGKDRELLQRYGEPAWNYQVIRFLDAEGDDLIPRKDRVWERDALALRMIEALTAAGRPVPHYLEVVAYEREPDELDAVAFAQACFWEGEMRLGGLPGVITTEAGWIEGREVTMVRYRSDLVSLDTLIERAVADGVADKVYVPRFSRRGLDDGGLAVGTLDRSYRRARESDQKRQIRSSAFPALDLTPMQQTKVNALAPIDRERALSWLTPAQLERLRSLDSR